MPNKRSTIWWIVLGIAMFLVIGTTALVRHLDGPRIVAFAEAPDGSAFCVVQRCNWSFEFFTTGCYFRKPNGRWYWFYYDHEDTYWGKGRTEIDLENREIIVYRAGRVTVRFDWANQIYKLRRRSLQRDQPLEDKPMPEGWEPAMAAS